MNWKPTEYMDDEIRRWMKSKGWEVSRTHWNHEQQIYAWRHDVRGGKSPTVRIHREVLEQYPPFAVSYHLDQLKLARLILAYPGVRLVVLQHDLKVTVAEVPAES
jgi:hypothetical protein